MAKVQLVIVFVLFWLGTIQSSPARAEPWIHVKVLERGHDAETVRVNLPVSLVESLLPLLEDKGGIHKSHFRVDRHDLSVAEMRKILTEVRKAEDGEYITVDGVDEKVRIEKKGEQLFITVDEQGEDPEHVEVRMRMKVLDALLSGKEDELNIAAALSTLTNGEELVRVESEDETVRIWVDDRNRTD